MFRAWQLILLIALCALGLGFADAVSDPKVRRTTVALADWPTGAPPVRAVLLADTHVAGPDMPPERLVRIVDQVNALHPDIVFVGGDLIGDKPVATRVYPTAQAIAPLGRLRARLGVVAVLGNHDDRAGTAPALAAIGIRLLVNDAMTLGPLAIGGIDEPYGGHGDIHRVLAAMAPLKGARVLLAHSPDALIGTPAGAFGLVLAGHTHCGQIVPPLLGQLVEVTFAPGKYDCGRIDEPGRTVIVTAGLGTSGVPLRLQAPPDVWLLTLGPKR